MPAAERPPAAGALTVLGDGEVELRGRLPWSSNGTFLTTVTLGDATTSAVYKPVRGELPLWDFPPGLFRREVAAYELSEALGWGLVPETVARDGPLGFGSLQRFVEADFREHYFTLLERPELGTRLKTICAFDMLLNNADRKSGHCLLGTDGRVWAIDHGLCFHEEPKLRTVIWDFEGLAVPEELLDDVAGLAAAVPPALLALLDDPEVTALAERARTLASRPLFPPARSGRSYPWPLV